MKREEQVHIEAIKRNDTTGLLELYRQYLPRISRFISSNGGNFDDAKDIFQDALMVIYKRVQQPDFELKSNFYTLLYGICRNLWGNQLQKKSRSEVTLNDDYKYTIEPGTAHLIEEQEESKLFWDAFKLLGKDCQQLLQLFFAKVKMVEIVAQMKLSSVSYAKKRKFQCKERLVQFVKADQRYFELTNKTTTHGTI